MSSPVLAQRQQATPRGGGSGDVTNMSATA